MPMRSMSGQSAASWPTSGNTVIASAVAVVSRSTALLTVARNSSTTKGLLTIPAKLAARLRRDVFASASARAALSAVNITTGRVGWARRIAAASSQVRLAPVDLTSPSRITQRGLPAVDCRTDERVVGDRYGVVAGLGQQTADELA